MNSYERRKAIKDEAMSNDMFYKTFQKESSAYENIFQKRLTEYASHFVEKHDNLKIDSIAGKISLSYNLRKHSSRLSSSVHAGFRCGHLYFENDANAACWIGPDVEFVQMQDDSVLVRRINKPDKSFDDYVAELFDSLIHECVRSLFKKFLVKFTNLQQASQFCSNMPAVSDPDNFLRSHYGEECINAHLLQLSSYAEDIVSQKFDLQPPEYLPDNAVKAEASVSGFNVCINSYNQVCVDFHINIKYGSKLNGQKEAKSHSGSMMPILLFTDADDIFLDECKLMIDKAANHVLNSVPVYFSDENSFSDKIKSYFTLNDTRKNGISGKYRYGMMTDRPCFIRWDPPVTIFQGNPIGKNSRIAELDAGFYMDLDDDKYTPESKACPGSDYDYLCFLDHADQLYGTMQLEGLNEKPKVKFEKINSKRMSCTSEFDHKYQLLSDGEHTMAELLHDLFGNILTDAVEEQNLSSVYVKAINDARLNPLELSVLKHICENGGTWKTDTEQFLKQKYSISSTAAYQCLDKLCSLVLRDSDPVETAVTCKIKKSMNYGRGTYDFYSPAPKLSVEIFDQLHARNFNADDLPYFTKSEQEMVCRQCCIAASTPDEKWSSLLLLEKLPKTAIRRFVQTEDGLYFFHSLEGQDRMYAGLMLGECSDKDCRQLSKELLGE